MLNTQIYLGRLKAMIQQSYNCGAVHFTTVTVHEVLPDRTIWQGEVEVFNLINHPTAKHCYGWPYGKPERFITVLELPPVTDAQSAVRVGIARLLQDAKVA
jgi:hypothetical protein